MRISDSAHGHLLHFHADPLHFSITMSEFIRQADEARAQLRYHLPRPLARLVERQVRRQSRQASTQVAPLVFGNPGDVEGPTTQAIERALAEGYEALWLVASVPIFSSEHKVWLEAEKVWGRLAAEYPLAVLCSYPMDHLHEATKVQAVFEEHALYYAGGQVHQTHNLDDCPSLSGGVSASF